MGQIMALDGEPSTSLPSPERSIFKRASFQLIWYHRMTLTFLSQSLIGSFLSPTVPEM